jgi:hypothetical protein
VPQLPQLWNWRRPCNKSQLRAEPKRRVV